MNFIDLLSILDTTTPSSATGLCTQLRPVLGLVGWVILGIKIAVPIILIIVGMMDLAKAITSKKDEEIKNAQSSLIKKAIAAVLVFLIATLVGILMSVIGAKDWKACTGCLNTPWDCPMTETIAG